MKKTFELIPLIIGILFILFWISIAASMGALIMVPFGVLMLIVFVSGLISNILKKDKNNVFDGDDYTVGVDDISSENYGRRRRNNVIDFSDKVEKESDFCPYCGQRTESEFEFCNRCGKRLP